MNLFLVKLFRHLNFRFLQLFRVINLSPNIGIGYIIQVLILVFIKLESNYYYLVIFSIPIFIFYFQRKDIFFLQHIFPHNWRIVVTIENLIIYLFVCCVNIHYKFDYFIIIPIALILLSTLFLSRKKRVRDLNNLSLLPSKFFEINSIYRKNPILFLGCLILMIISGFHPFTLFFYGIFFMDYFANIYKFNESKEQLIMYFTKQSLGSKVLLNLKFFNTILVFTFIFYLIMNNPIHFFLIYYIVINIFFTLILLRKYSQYSYKKKENEYNTGVYMENLIISVLIIPAMFKANEFYKLATKNINEYVENK